MIQTGNNIVSIYTEVTPNPDTMKFVANRLLYPNKSADFSSEQSAKASPLATSLFMYPFVKSVFIASNFVTLTKNQDADWQDIIPTLKTFLQDYLQENKPIINEAELEAEQVHLPQAEDSDVVRRIKELLDNYVKPAVEMDGGAILFKSYKDGILVLSMQGACSGCPSSMITLKAGIEGIMKRMVPEVKEVVADI